MNTLEKAVKSLTAQEARDMAWLQKRRQQRMDRITLIKAAVEGAEIPDGTLPAGVARTLALEGLSPSNWANYRWRAVGAGLGRTGAKGVYQNPDGSYYVQLRIPNGKGAVRTPLFTSSDVNECAAFYDRCARALGCPEALLNFPEVAQ